MKLISAAFVGVVALILSGCISGANFVSVEKKFSERVPASGIHHVKRGETLYAIAWTYGRLISEYSATAPVNKGIDIAGSMGDSIFAATDGTVVYAGQGLRGYGNLVIVKHNDTYLSAYAHASRILVSEQEKVSVGQKIAEIGSTGTDKVMLHFEIRQNGKPVDPLHYLPKRTGG